MCGVINITERICGICEMPFYPRHGNQKYCSDECVKEARRINDMEYRKRWKWLYGKRKKNMNKGTGSLGCIPEDDFFDEYRMVQKEKARIGL